MQQQTKDLNRATYYTNPTRKHDESLHFGSAKLQLGSDQIHTLRQLDVEGAQAGFVVSSENNVNCVPQVMPIRMVLVALRQLCGLRHEVKRLLEVLEHERTLQRVTGYIVLDQSPFWNSLDILVRLR